MTARTTLAGHWRRRLGVQVTTIDENLVSAEGPAPAAADPLPRIPPNPRESLPPNYRRVLELRFLERCSVGETATRMGISAGNARVVQYPRAAARRRAGTGGGRMNRRIRRVSRWVDDLLHDRSPRRFGGARGGTPRFWLPRSSCRVRAPVLDSGSSVRPSPSGSGSRERHKARCRCRRGCRGARCSPAAGLRSPPAAAGVVIGDRLASPSTAQKELLPVGATGRRWPVSQTFR